MRAMPFAGANAVFGLQGGGPENGLPAKVGEHAAPDGVVEATDPCASMPYAITRWTPDSDERGALAVGADVELIVLGGGVPPLAMRTVREGELLDMFVWCSIPPTAARRLVQLVARNRVEALLDAAVLTQAERVALEELDLFADAIRGALRSLDDEMPAKPPPPPRKRRG